MLSIYSPAHASTRRHLAQVVASTLVAVCLVAHLAPVPSAHASASIAFAAAVTYTTGRSPAGIVVADFDGDGRADVAVANKGGDSISIFLGNGDGTLKARVDYAAGNDPEGIAAGDFNLDGRIDLGVVNYSANTLSVFLGNGDGSFAAKVDYPTGTGPIAVDTGDFNLDGRLDLVTANYLVNQVDIFLGNGDGTFAAKVAFGAGTYPAGLAVRDFNRDGRLDVITASFNNSKVSLLAGKGDGTFEARVEFATGSTPMGVVAGDFNQDGKLDIATPNRYGNSASILTGNGDGSFAAKSDYGLAGNPYGMVAADFNRDGTLDLATANYSGSSVSILPGKGDGTFGSKIDLASPTNPESIAAGDLNQDGKPDLVTTNFGSNNLSVLLNTTALATSNVMPKVDFPTGVRPYAVASGDFNRDGKADIVSANYTARSVSFIGGNGDGTFAPKVDYTVGSNPAAVAVADFNLDGKQDLVTANFVGNNVSILVGVGDGTFHTRVDTPAGSAATSVAAGDFNRDGKPDVATANRNANTISVLTGNGNGTLNAKVDYAAGTQPIFIATGDFDRDGILDLVVANWSVDTLGLFKGNGDGTFGTMVSFGVGDTPSALAVGDLNLDGKLDLVSANRGTSNVSVLYGKGDGTFNPQVTYAAGIFPMAVTLGDLNLDGRPDIVVGNNADHDASVLIGKADGTFSPRVDYATGNYPRGVHVADLNADGRPEVVVANSDSDSASILWQAVNAADLRLVKRVLPPSVAPGGAVTYTLVYSNSGVITATAVLLSDSIPVSVTNTAVTATGATLVPVGGSRYIWQVADLAPGQGGVITITGVLSQALAGGAIITNTALITSTTADQNLADNAGAAAVTLGNSAPVVTLTSAPNPSRFGEAVTFAALVAPAGAGGSQPTGTVSFAAGGAQLGSAPVGAAGTASFVTASLPRGSHSVTASYGGDGTYSGAQSAPYPQTVDKAATVITLDGLPNPAVYGDEVVLSAAVAAATPGSGLPAGLVTFKSNGATLGTGAVDGTGRATLALTGLMPGIHAVVAEYGGDYNFLAGISGTLEQEIKPLPTATTLDISSNPAILGQPLYFTATVVGLSPDSILRTAATPSGDVTFMNGEMALATVTLDGQGQASFVTAAMAEGMHEVTVVYSGNAYFGGSLADPETLLVHRLPLALNDAAGTLEDTPVLIDVLANDLDATVGAMSIAEVANAGHGRIDIAGNGKSLTYTPAAGFTGVDSFTYGVVGSDGGTDTAMVTVVVSARSATNQAPLVAPVDLRAAGTQRFVSPQAVITAQLPAGIYGGVVGPKDLFFVSYTAIVTPSAHVAGPPAGLKFGNFNFLLGAYVNNVPLPEMQFARPLTLTVVYGPDLVGASAAEQPAVYQWNGSGWSTAGIDCLENDTASRTIRFTILRPGEFAFFIASRPSTGSGLWLPVLSRGDTQGQSAGDEGREWVDHESTPPPGSTWRDVLPRLFLPAMSR
jgi:uncharacterized repeat protein (TIGR01451 family)